MEFSCYLIGVTSLIFNAKGHYFGQILMIVFSLFYGYVSFQFGYYGEMITYIGMTLPMSLISLISWIKHPYGNQHQEVKIHHLNKKDYILMIFLTLIVTIIFGFILTYFNTKNLILSTISITTSFMAVYFSYQRSTYFALSYAINDLILIILWLLASVKDFSYISLVTCFIIFFINDLYGFYNWKRLEKKQKKIDKKEIFYLHCHTIW